MLAKILGVLLLIGGVVWGFKLIWPCVRQPLWFARRGCGRGSWLPERST